MKRFEKSVVAVVAVVAFALTLGGCTAGPATNTNQPAATPTVEPSVPQQLPVDFSETGTILNWDAATEKPTDVWSLLYEKPGEPALKVTLKFEPKSTCSADGAAVTCDTSAFKNGDRVTLEGARDGATVTVASLTKGATAQIANPASVYCVERGGQVVIRKARDGSERGWCAFLPDGPECDEWEFYRNKGCL